MLYHASKKDGRNAYIALKAHYQGSSYHELMKTQATTMMTKTYYHGDRAPFNREDYVATHVEAHELFKVRRMALGIVQ